MKEKLTNNNEDYDEDIPSRENWKRYNVDTIKRLFSDWLDHNIEHEYQSYPEFFLKEGEKRFYMRIIEEGASDDDPEDEGYTDEDPEDEGYYCIVEPFETKRVEDL